MVMCGGGIGVCHVAFFFLVCSFLERPYGHLRGFQKQYLSLWYLSAQLCASFQEGYWEEWEGTWCLPVRQPE